MSRYNAALAAPYTEPRYGPALGSIVQVPSGRQGRVVGLLFREDVAIVQLARGVVYVGYSALRGVTL